MSALIAIVRALLGRLVLAAVFGLVAFLLAQQVAGNMTERLGSAPQVTPAPPATAAP